MLVEEGEESFSRVSDFVKESLGHEEGAGECMVLLLNWGGNLSDGNSFLGGSGMERFRIAGGVRD